MTQPDAAEARRLAAAAGRETARPRPDYDRAVILHQQAVERSEQAYRQAGDDDDPEESVTEAAGALADHWGRLGGALRRAGRLDEAVGAYGNGARIESDHGLADTYNRTNVITLEVLRDPGRLSALGATVQETLAVVQAQTEGQRRTQPWAYADLGLLNLLAGRDHAARTAYLNFVRTGPERPYAESALDVLRQLRAAVATVADVAGFDEAIRIVESSIT